MSSERVFGEEYGSVGYGIERYGGDPGRPIDTEMVVALGKELIKGRSIADTARIVGCSEPTVRHWKTRLGLADRVQRDPRVSPREGDVVRFKDNGLDLRVELVRAREVFVSAQPPSAPRPSFWRVLKSEWCPVLMEWEVVEKGEE